MRYTLKEMDAMDPVLAMKTFCYRPIRKSFLIARASDYSLTILPALPGATNGKVGVVRKSHLITSPNMTYVPDVQLDDCVVHLRTNFRFGIDDCTQWPQWLRSSLPHLPAIPRRPSSMSPPHSRDFGVMWWTPKRSCFKLVEGVEGTTAGKLVGREIEELVRLKCDLVEEAHRIMTEIEGEKGDKGYAALVPGMGATTTFLRHGALGLTQCSAGFDQKRLELAEVQRAWLEVKGMTNYYRWKRERNDRGHAIPSGEPEWCMGCFVDNANAASMYWAMGVPVWLVQRKLDVYQSGIHIDKPTEKTRRPSDEEPPVELTIQPQFPAIFTGSPKVAGHHEQQQAHARIRIAIPTETPRGLVYDPISRLRGDREAVLATTFRTMEEMARDATFESPEPSSASTSARSERYAPCKFYCACLLPTVP